MQKQRQEATLTDIQFYDRSLFCTYALNHYLDFPTSQLLIKEIDMLLKEKTYEAKVFFLENLGFIENTNARKISFDESLIFEEIHLNVYKEFGFQIVKVPGMPIFERTDFILNRLH